MLKLRKIRNDFNIPYSEIAKYLGLSIIVVKHKFANRVDFTVVELKYLKDFFVKKKVIDEDFYYADLLEEVD